MITNSGIIVEVLAERNGQFLCKYVRNYIGHNGNGTFENKYAEICDEKCWFYADYSLRPFPFDNRKEVIE